LKQQLSSSLPVLIVDDEISFAKSVSYILASSGIDALQECSDSRNVIDILSKQEFGVVLLDINMPFIRGDELLKEIIDKFPNLSIIMITATHDIDTAVHCIRCGAFDYLVKPVDKDRLVTVVRNALTILETNNENHRLKQSFLSDKLHNPGVFSKIITQSSQMYTMFKYIEAIAQTTFPVLITGETGTGKELIAQSVHIASCRKGNFIPVNVAGGEANMFSDMLFGHEKGSFTGADSHRSGLIEKASGGTLFLDEISELSMDLQVRLLRILQEKQYYPVGSDVAKVSDARIVVATNRNLIELVESGSFRRDLYFRLQYHQINLPPLRKRLEDLPLLIQHFASEASLSMHKKEPVVNPQLYSLLRMYNFPGNVRELQAMVFDAVSRQEGDVLSSETFKQRMTQVSNAQNVSTKFDNAGASSDIIFSDNLPTIRQAIDMVISEALRRSKGNQTVAANLLGITRRALNNRIHRNQNLL